MVCADGERGNSELIYMQALEYSFLSFSVKKSFNELDKIVCSCLNRPRCAVNRKTSTAKTTTKGKNIKEEFLCRLSCINFGV